MIKRLKKLLYVTTSILLLQFGLIYFQSCEQDFGPTPEGNSEFPDEIYDIFNTPYTSAGLSCNTPSCHGSGEPARGFDLTNWQRTINGSENGTMVIPYNGFWSHMISYLNLDTTYAPVSFIDPVSTLLYESHKIDSNKVKTIRNWIDGGAQHKDGQVAFSNIPESEKGFITNQAADLVAVLIPNTKQVIRLVPVGGRPNDIDAPHYVTLSPDNQFFYISLIQEGYVEKYRVSDYSRVGRMQAGQSPSHIEVSSDGNFGYVTNFESSGSITTTRKFNTSTMSVTDVFSDQRMTGPHGMALTNDGSVLYVTSEIGEYIYKISTNKFYSSDSTYLKEPIDPSVPPTGAGTGNFKPYQVILSPDENLLFVSCRGANEIRIYDSGDLHQVNSISLGSGALPLLMKFTNDGNYLFVCNRNNNTVSVINRATQTLQTTIGDVGIQPHGVDFTSDGQYAIIACETQTGFNGHHPTVGSIKVGITRLIQVSNFSLMPDRLQMGSFPAGIVIVK
ncbi:MAG: beta-propeller fold lactonase family protein [Bacteroidota bacterium]|nr:beta-propeller fold lactonase family protein [Bacteroidota bacterium]